MAFSERIGTREVVGTVTVKAMLTRAIAKDSNNTNIIVVVVVDLDDDDGIILGLQRRAAPRRDDDDDDDVVDTCTDSIMVTDGPWRWDPFVRCWLTD